MAKLLEHHKDIMDFLRAHGAQDISTENTKGGHVKINFMWRGERLNYITSGTPSDHRATLNAIAHLRSRLGSPVEKAITKVTRTLAELTADIPLKTHGSPELDEDAAKLMALGADPGPTLEDIMPTPSIIKLSDAPTQDHDVCYVGLYNKDGGKLLRINIPIPMHEQIGSPPHVTIARVDGNTWEIVPDLQGASQVARYGNTRKGYVITECCAPDLAMGLDTWGMTAGTAVVVDGSILISLDLAKLRPRMVFRNKGKGDKQVPPHEGGPEWWTNPATPVKTTAVLPSTPLSNPVGVTKEEIRHALDVISHVAKTMPVKLVRKNDRYEFVLDLD